MRLFFTAHRAGEIRIWIVKAGFLHNRTTRFDDGSLSIDFIMQGPFHKAEGVNVLEFGSGPEHGFTPRPD